MRRVLCLPSLVLLPPKSHGRASHCVSHWTTGPQWHYHSSSKQKKQGLAAAKCWEEALLPARAQWLRCLVSMKKGERGRQGGRKSGGHTHTEICLKISSVLPDFFPRTDTLHSSTLPQRKCHSDEKLQHSHILETWQHHLLQHIPTTIVPRGLWESPSHISVTVGRMNAPHLEQSAVFPCSSLGWSE